jgi:SOS response regulatory protein OraA/RecX
MPVVTALRAKGAHVAVELDGAPWRTLPVEAVVESGLGMGAELDSARARILVGALRRQRAEGVALRALARGDHSHASLDARLARAGIREHERRTVLERAERARLVDDVRFAAARAALLAERGKGDLAIRDDLARAGIGENHAREAVAALEPERERASRIVAVRGASIRTARFLATRGFSEETVEEVVADLGI